MMEYMFPALLGMAISAIAFVAFKFMDSNATIKRFLEREQRLSGIVPGDEKLKTGKGERIHYPAFDHPGLLREVYWAGYRGAVATKMVRSLPKLCIGITVGCVGATMVFGLGQNYLLGSLVSGVVVFFLFKNYIKGQKIKRISTIERELPQFLDLLVTTVESGMGFMSSIRVLLAHVGTTNPLWKEMQVMEREYAGGLALTDACERLSKRCGVDNISAVVGNLIQSEQIGASLGRTLRVLAAETRSKRRSAMKEKAGKLPVELVMPSGLIFVCMMILLMGPSMVNVMGTLKGV